MEDRDEEEEYVEYEISLPDVMWRHVNRAARRSRLSTEEFLIRAVQREINREKGRPDDRPDE